LIGLEAVFVGDNTELARQVFANRGGFFLLAHKASKKNPTKSGGNLTNKAVLNPMSIAS